MDGSERRGGGITPQQLASACQEVETRFSSSAVLVRNQVGNLAVMVDGEYRGYIDLSTGEVGGWPI